MMPWRAGDPVGMGEVFLPDEKTKAAYTKACQDSYLTTVARHAISLPTLEERREFIANYPKGGQEALKARMQELWTSKRD